VNVNSRRLVVRTVHPVIKRTICNLCVCAIEDVDRRFIGIVDVAVINRRIGRQDSNDYSGIPRVICRAVFYNGAGASVGVVILTPRFRMVRIIGVAGIVAVYYYSLPWVVGNAVVHRYVLANVNYNAVLVKISGDTILDGSPVHAGEIDPVRIVASRWESIK